MLKMGLIDQNRFHYLPLYLPLGLLEHPGHLHYLEKSAEKGDRLVVVIARDSRLEERRTVFSDEERRKMVQALEAVDEAVLGSEGDIYSTVEEIDPDVIVLGHDQHHDERAIERALAERGIDCAVRRASPCEPDFDDAVLSTGTIVDRICEERC